MNTVSLRHNAIFIPSSRLHPAVEMTPESAAFVSMLGQYGYEVSEELLHALNGCTPSELEAIAAEIRKAYNVGLNWSALVRGWQAPTGESVVDHLITLFANLDMVSLPSVTLPCGHKIPVGTFPLDRYTGCPFCGKPFVTTDFNYVGQGSAKKQLDLWTEADLEALYKRMLESRVPLDATAVDSLLTLIEHFPLPEGVEVPMKETRIMVASKLLNQGDTTAAFGLLQTPTDLLRLIWYRRTDHLRIIRPRTYAKLALALGWEGASHGVPRGGVREVIKNIHLKFPRSFSRAAALWLNGLNASPSTLCEDMHKHRGMWVRIIRALRLAEYSHKPGMEKLAETLDRFYNGNYRVWKGEVDVAIAAGDSQRAFSLLKERPGVFARSLFALIGRFGLQPVMENFEDVVDNVAPRILLGMSAVAEEYFLSPDDRRSVGAPGFKRVTVDLPESVRRLSTEERANAIVALNELYVKAMERRFSKEPAPAGPIYIAPELFEIPVPSGERSTVKSDLPPAYQGQRFKVEGDSVRLFLQWGEGLPAQWLDMDLSAVLVDKDGNREDCAYYNLSFDGARHSGDIRQIPDQVGTAEYVELNIPELLENGWRYAMFTCNAYSSDTLDPRLVVGWMSSAYPMAVSDETGVAYDPSTVQHMVRISETNLMRGLVFGFMDLAERTVFWVEMPLTSRIAAQLDPEQIKAYIRRLKARPTIGKMLTDKALIQGTPITDNPSEAAVQYTLRFAYDPAAIAQELL